MNLAQDMITALATNTSRRFQHSLRSIMINPKELENKGKHRQNISCISDTCSSVNPLFFRIAFKRSLRFRASSSKLPSTAAILNLTAQRLVGMTRGSREKIYSENKMADVWLLKTFLA